MVKENQTTSYLNIFITVVLALAFIIAIASLTQERTTTTAVTNEVVSVAAANLGQAGLNVSKNLGPVTYYPTDWRVEDCPLTNIVVTNASGTALTVTTDYTLDTTTGILNIKNTTATVNAFATNNNSLIDYNYCGNGYVNSNWGRTVLNTNVGLYAIAILIIVVALVYLLMKDND